MKIVCIGDSLTYGYRIRRSQVWTKLLENKMESGVLNKGINGDSTGGMLSRYQKDVIDNSPSHVIIMGGSNDLIMELSLNIVKSNIATMVHQAHANNIIPVIGIPPLTVPKMAEKTWADGTDYDRMNEEIEVYREWAIDFGERFGVQILDFCSKFRAIVNEENKHEFYIDGLHITPKGNIVMADMVDLK